MKEEESFMNIPEKPNNLSPREAIALIGQYFPKEWKYFNDEDVNTKRLQTGYCNEVYVVWNDKTKREPRRVIVRKYGGNTISKHRESMRPLTTTEELILVCELGRRNLAPKLLGFFDGGRIEEFIDCHEMTMQETSVPEIQRDMAKTLARFHAIDNVPFPKPGYDFCQVLRSHYRGAAENIRKVLEIKELQSVHDVMKHDWEKEIDWLSPLMNLDRHRMVLMHWDCHIQNIGVRNTKKEELATILFDFEFSTYNMRGKDIGMFLISKMDLIGSSDMKVPETQIDFPSLQDCKLFIDEYMKECKTLFDDWNEDSIDSFDHIMMESLIGVMVSCIFYIFSGINTFQEFLEISPDFGVINRMSDCFFICKKRLKSDYADYNTRL